MPQQPESLGTPKTDSAHCTLIGAGIGYRSAGKSNWKSRFNLNPEVEDGFNSPCLKGLLALQRGEPARVLELLRASLPYDLAVTRGAMHGNFGAMYTAYVGGEAYLALRAGSEVATEFQKILDHPGVVGNDLIGALARLQLARSYAVAKK